MRNDALIVGGVLIGLYLFRERLGAMFNPASPQNIVNRSVESLYQGVTGSTGTPGGDLATAVHKNADADSLLVLANYFAANGISDTTIAKATDIGWTATDIDRATEQARNIYGPPIDEIPTFY